MDNLGLDPIGRHLQPQYRSPDPGRLKYKLEPIPCASDVYDRTPVFQLKVKATPSLSNGKDFNRLKLRNDLQQISQFNQDQRRNTTNMDKYPLHKRSEGDWEDSIQDFKHKQAQTRRVLPNPITISNAASTQGHTNFLSQDSGDYDPYPK